MGQGTDTHNVHDGPFLANKINLSFIPSRSTFYIDSTVIWLCTPLMKQGQGVGMAGEAQARTHTHAQPHRHTQTCTHTHTHTHTCARTRAQARTHTHTHTHTDTRVLCTFRERDGGRTREARRDAREDRERVGGTTEERVPYLQGKEMREWRPILIDSKPCLGRYVTLRNDSWPGQVGGQLHLQGNAT